MALSRTGAACAYVTALFFIWGAVTSFNDVLIPAVKTIFSLSDTASFLTELAVFLAYGIVSLPAAAAMLARIRQRHDKAAYDHRHQRQHDRVGRSEEGTPAAAH